MSCFATEALKYWSNGLSVVPAFRNTKRPALESWTSYANNPPNEQLQNTWVSKYKDCGLAHLLGTNIDNEYALAAIDIDDDALVEPTKTILGNCPSGKRGKKGATFYVKMPKLENLKSTTIVGGGWAVGTSYGTAQSD